MAHRPRPKWPGWCARQCATEVDKSDASLVPMEVRVSKPDAIKSDFGLPGKLIRAQREATVVLKSKRPGAEAGPLKDSSCIAASYTITPPAL
jgi:hypothetical protein